MSDADFVLRHTRAWLDKVVIGLNLCPFAALPLRRGRIRYRVSAAVTAEQVLVDLLDELSRLRDADPEEIATTLLIAPDALADFLEYNDFLDIADAVLVEMGLEGEIQIASFHPDYRFAGTEPDNVGNYTNRAPYPILHLLREQEIENAVAGYPLIDSVPDNNIQTMQTLGKARIEALLRACREEAQRE